MPGPARCSPSERGGLAHGGPWLQVKPGQSPGGPPFPCASGAGSSVSGGRCRGRHTAGVLWAGAPVLLDELCPVSVQLSLDSELTCLQNHQLWRGGHGGCPGL